MAFKAIFSVLIVFGLLFPVGAVRNVFGYCHFNEIYQLGDSMSDAGNLVREFPVGASINFARPPYGQTFFEEATGRCSNGLLMIDYIGKININLFWLIIIVAFNLVTITIVNI